MWRCARRLAAGRRSAASRDPWRLSKTGAGRRDRGTRRIDRRAWRRRAARFGAGIAADAGGAGERDTRPDLWLEGRQTNRRGPSRGVERDRRRAAKEDAADRKSAVRGKSVAVRVVLGGVRVFKKKK